MTRLGCGLGLLALMMGGAWADAQTAQNIAVLKGLAPVSALSNTTDGKAALAANFTVTGGIQTGAIRQPTLLPFAEQQQQALRDAFITDGNLAQLADGLGATLGAAYQARAHYLDRERFTSISDAVPTSSHTPTRHRDPIRTRANTSLLMARRTARSQSRMKRRPFSRTSPAPPMPLASPMAGRGERRAPTRSGTLARFRRNLRFCRSSARTTSMFRRATRFTTAARS